MSLHSQLSQDMIYAVFCVCRHWIVINKVWTVNKNIKCVKILLALKNKFYLDLICLLIKYWSRTYKTQGKLLKWLVFVINFLHLNHCLRNSWVKLGRKGRWVDPNVNFIWYAAITKNRKFWYDPKQLFLKPESAQI